MKEFKERVSGKVVAAGDIVRHIVQRYGVSRTQAG